MPTYEYECQECEHRFDVLQKMTDDPLDTCPECGGKVERLLSAGAGIIFKGSGFYATDYRSESYKKKAKEETSSGETKDAKKDSDKSSTSKDTSGTTSD